MPSLHLTSHLQVDPATFWQTAGTLDGVNAELAPLVRMSCPAAFRHTPLAQWPTGRVLFDSWILLGGVLPVDRHRFKLQQVQPGQGFEETSSTWVHALWHHRRRTVATPQGCVVEDRLDIHSRVPGLAWLLWPAIRAVFAHRHRRLRRRWGGLPPV